MANSFFLQITHTSKSSLKTYPIKGRQQNNDNLIKIETAGVFCSSLGLLLIHVYDTVSDHLESLSTSVPESLTAGRLNGQCSGLYG